MIVSLVMLNVSLFIASPINSLRALIFKEMIAPPKLLMVDSIPGAETYETKMKLGKMVKAFSMVSLNQ